jgi:hypothetical protein
MVSSLRGSQAQRGENFTTARQAALIGVAGVLLVIAAVVDWPCGGRWSKLANRDQRVFDREGPRIHMFVHHHHHSDKCSPPAYLILSYSSVCTRHVGGTASGESPLALVAVVDIRLRPRRVCPLCRCGHNRYDSHARISYGQTANVTHGGSLRRGNTSRWMRMRNEQ